MIKMDIYEFGSPASSLILVQMADEHDLKTIDREVSLIKEYASDDFRLIVFKVKNWNQDLSPWKAPAVFGKEDFGEGAAKTLSEIIKHIDGKGSEYIIGGYSLAGLFALWGACNTDLFKGVAAASPSVWFPGLIDYMKETEIKAKTVYLSLGEKEEKTHNPVMATVGNNIRFVKEILSEKNINTILEWNPGNHFKDADIRMAKAFAWVMKGMQNNCCNFNWYSSESFPFLHICICNQSGKYSRNESAKYDAGYYNAI